MVIAGSVSFSPTMNGSDLAIRLIYGSMGTLRLVHPQDEPQALATNKRLSRG